jgi:hypothetical protein
MIFKIWKERNKILEGIANSVFKKEHVEQVAAHRKAICTTCPSLDLTGEKCAVIATQPCCGECGCSLNLKTRSLSSSCPKGHWEAELTEAEEQALLKQIKE